jgi:hypothetical protein
LDCESLIDRSQQIISDEKKGILHLPEHYIVSGCSIDVANILSLSFDDNLQYDGSLFVPLIPHSMLLESLMSSTASPQLYGRLRHEVVLNFLTQFSPQGLGTEYDSIPVLPKLDGILLTRDTGLLLPDMIFWPSDTLQVAQLDTISLLTGGYERTKWWLLITTVAACIIIASLIAESRLAYIDSPDHRGISLISALTKRSGVDCLPA